MADKDEAQVKWLKKKVEGWREIVINAYSILTWEQDWYPAVIFGALSFLYFCVWYWSPSLVTLVATLGLVASLADYFVPMILSKVFDPNAWTGVQEEKLEKACREAIVSYALFRSCVGAWFEMKTTKPKIHFFVTVLVLLLLAWWGNKFNGFFFTYVTALKVAMLPGLHHKGLLKKYCAQFTLKIAEFVQSKDKKEN